MEAQLLAILQILAAVIPEATTIGTTAIQAFQAKDQASLDAAHDKAVALATALKPAGD